jgi:hypothetical protein
MTQAHELGLGILLAASLSVASLAKIFRCSEAEAEGFKCQAIADLCTLNHQIKAARKLSN